MDSASRKTLSFERHRSKIWEGVRSPRDRDRAVRIGWGAKAEVNIDVLVDSFTNGGNSSNCNEIRNMQQTGAKTRRNRRTSDVPANMVIFWRETVRVMSE